MEDKKLSIVAIVISITTLIFTASWNIYTFQIEQIRQNFEPRILLSYIGEIRVPTNLNDVVPLTAPFSLIINIISPNEYILEVGSVLFIPNSNVAESRRLVFENITINLVTPIVAIGGKGTSTISLFTPVRVNIIEHLSSTATDVLLGNLNVSILYEDAVTKKNN